MLADVQGAQTGHLIETLRVPNWAPNDFPMVPKGVAS